MDKCKDCPHCFKRQCENGISLNCLRETREVENDEIQPLQHIVLSAPKFEVGDKIATATIKVHAQVTNLQEKAVVEAITVFAQKQGFTDLFLIDEDFIKSAIMHEMERRNKGGN